MSHYDAQKSKLLKEFDNTSSLMQDYLVWLYGQEFAETLSREARLEYENLIPEAVSYTHLTLPTSDLV